MRFFLISDNSDAMNGLRLAGIEGTVARSEADLRNALEMAAQQPDIAVLLVTEKIAETYTATLDSARAAGGDGATDAFRICRIGQDRKNHAAQAFHRGYAAGCDGERGQGGYAR